MYVEMEDRRWGPETISFQENGGGRYCQVGWAVSGWCPFSPIILRVTKPSNHRRQKGQLSVWTKERLDFSLMRDSRWLTSLKMQMDTASSWDSMPYTENRQFFFFFSIFKLLTVGRGVLNRGPNSCLRTMILILFKMKMAPSRAP